MNRQILFVVLILTAFSCSQPYTSEVSVWHTHEIVLKADSSYMNAYTDVDVWASFYTSEGDTLLRPAFWDGDSTWKIRFAPPQEGQVWHWKSYASVEDGGLEGKKGSLKVIMDTTHHSLLSHGLLEMSAAKRNVKHKDGTPFLLVGDTPWAIPFRATKEQVDLYAADRKEKGFNAALLMSVQPDMEATGPQGRNQVQGFSRAFADLSDGHINFIRPQYFQYLDTLMLSLLDHGIVPVYQPVFHGFGWKGLNVLGNHIDPDEYVRYVKYLLARYGSMPAMWLLAGDNGGRDPGVKESGEMLSKWDCYKQPTGLHYNPCDDYVADWAVDNPIKHCLHRNQTWQGEEWLDFQWAQTGHGGEHLYHKVERMYDNLPTKASANGEPTYEGMNDGKNGLGWWQGEEAWMQLMSGGTMGVVYGAAGLWQWKITADEEGWGSWAGQKKSWKEAMAMEGSIYVGYVGKALRDFDITDIEKKSELTANEFPLLAREGKLYISYMNKGGRINIENVPAGLPYRWFDPENGEFLAEGMTDGETEFTAPGQKPWVLIIGERIKNV